ncbi:hypothetical protein [Carnobacterium antarcticum]|uniref:Uncharacterized protein n=1 Tax=Carnobacterium antarcticum TaxID=2126436 RepID=A0ABW4NKD8_9LACT|nr:hypothetical protein [Carnobacterium sp. CP1]
MGQLWKTASDEISRRSNRSETSEHFEFKELFLLSPHSLLELQKVKKWRQEKFPREKGRPTVGHESHKKFYDRYKLNFKN